MKPRFHGPAATIAMSAVFFIAACGGSHKNAESAEDAGEAIDESADDAEDAADEAAEDVEDAVDEAAEDVDDAVDDAK